MRATRGFAGRGFQSAEIFARRDTVCVMQQRHVRPIKKKKNRGVVSRSPLKQCRRISGRTASDLPSQRSTGKGPVMIKLLR